MPLQGSGRRVECHLTLKSVEGGMARYATLSWCHAARLKTLRLNLPFWFAIQK
jgi:hypothetical protein